MQKCLGISRFNNFITLFYLQKSEEFEIMARSARMRRHVHPTQFVTSAANHNKSAVVWRFPWLHTDVY